MAGGTHNDTYVIGISGDTVMEAPNEGFDTVRTSISLSLQANVERMAMTGGGNLNGNGNSLNNAIFGTVGNNLLNGALGNDTITGGAGADTIAFNTAIGATNRDVVTDFDDVFDTIMLDNAIFVTLGAATGAPSASFFRIGAAAEANDYILYNSANGQLLYDADESGAAAAVLFATLNAGLALSAANFIVN